LSGRLSLYAIYIDAAQRNARIYTPFARHSPVFGDASMMDLILILAGAAMFAVGIAYTYACERL
jgi:hypothetical protein